MYREQNYIFSFTFVYKSKTACLIKHLFKKKEKRKNKHPQTFSSFFLDSEDFTICPVVWLLFYFNGIIFLAITETIACMRFKLWALLWGRVWDSFDFHFFKSDRLGFCLCVRGFYQP